MSIRSAVPKDAKAPSGGIVRRILQWFFTPALLLALWLFLHESLAPGQIVLGACVALVLSWAAYHLRPLQAVMRRPATVLGLFAHVMIDITRSNLAVFRLIVLGKTRSGATPGFLRIPLRMRDPHGLAALACIITFTPGTVWADYAQDENLLTLHVLDLKDEDRWRALIRDRYETPLMEIYACTP